MPFRVDILENGEFIKREYFDNLKEAKSFQDLWNGYHRIPGVPWIALIINGIELFRERMEEENKCLLTKLNPFTFGNDPSLGK